jgi:hypothetical protein
MNFFPQRVSRGVALNRETKTRRGIRLKRVLIIYTLVLDALRAPQPLKRFAVSASSAPTCTRKLGLKYRERRLLRLVNGDLRQWWRGHHKPEVRPSFLSNAAQVHQVWPELFILKNKNLPCGIFARP